MTTIELDEGEKAALAAVTNLAARLCAEAKDGQILVSRRVAIATEDSATLEEIGDLSLKGLSQAVAVYNVVAVGHFSVNFLTGCGFPGDIAAAPNCACA